MINPQNEVWVLRVGEFVLGVVTCKSKAQLIVDEHKERGILVEMSPHTLDSTGRATIRYEPSKAVDISRHITEPLPMRPQ